MACRGAESRAAVPGRRALDATSRGWRDSPVVGERERWQRDDLPVPVSHRRPDRRHAAVRHRARYPRLHVLRRRDAPGVHRADARARSRAESWRPSTGPRPAPSPRPSSRRFPGPDGGPRSPRRTRSCAGCRGRDPVRYPEERPMPEVVFPLDSSKKFTDQQIVGHNRWHPDIPAQVHVKPGDVVPGALPGMVRRRDRQRRLGGGRPQRAAARGARAQRADRRRGGRARRPADRRHPRRRPDPAGGLRAAGRPGLGLHRGVRHAERRRLPHRAVPRRVQGDLGLPRAASPPRGTSPGSRSPASCTRA